LGGPKPPWTEGDADPRCKGVILPDLPALGELLADSNIERKIILPLEVKVLTSLPGQGRGIIVADFKGETTRSRLLGTGSRIDTGGARSVVRNYLNLNPLIPP